MKDVKAINEKLREYQKEWYLQICEPWINNRGSCPEKMKEWVEKRYDKKAQYSFSQPFFTGVMDDGSKPLIMFIGQETNGWGLIEDFNVYGKRSWDIVNSQKSGLDILKAKLSSLPVNASPFWRFIYSIKMERSEYDIGVVWNNLDKIHYRVNNAKINDKNKDIECVTLYEKDEEELNKIIDKYGKTLLQLEIETINPDLIVFLTGPTYKKSMEKALGIELIEKPTLDCLVVPINDKILWTYHPSFLFRDVKMTENANSEIIKKIKTLSSKNDG